MKKEDFIDFNIRYVWQKFARKYNAEAAKNDLTMSWGFTLLNIDNKKGTPSTKLGPSMGMESTSLTRILKNMETEGLIERKPDNRDKRMVRLFLTKQGEKARDIAATNVMKVDQLIRSNISPDKLNTFMQVIDSLNKLLDDKNIFESNTKK